MLWWVSMDGAPTRRVVAEYASAAATNYAVCLEPRRLHEPLAIRVRRFPIGLAEDYGVVDDGDVACAVRVRF